MNRPVMTDLPWSMRQLALCLAMVAGLLIAAPLARAADEQKAVLTQVPDDAAIVVSIAKFSKFARGIDQLAMDVAPNQGIAPSQFLELGLTGFFNISKGFDRDGPMAVIVPNFAKADIGELNQFTAPNALVAVIPFTNVNEMLANFGFEAGELKAGSVASKGDRFYAVTGRFVMISQQEKNLKSVVLAGGAKSAWAALSNGQQKNAAAQDVYIYFKPAACGEAYENILALGKGLLEAQVPEEQRAQLKKLIDVASSVSHLSAGVSFDKGVGLSLAMAPKVGGAFADMLAKSGTDASTLDGLPTAGQPFVIFGQVSDPNQINAFGSVADNIKNSLKSIEGVGEFLTEDKIAKIAEASEALAKLTRNQRGVIYRNANIQEAGLFAGTLVIETADGAAYVGHLKTLFDIATDTVARAVANGQLPDQVKASYKTAGSLDGSPVTVFSFDLPAELLDGNADAAKTFFGGSWNKIQFVQRGPFVVISLGSDQAGLATTVGNLKIGDKGLSNTALVQSSPRGSVPVLGAEFHLSLRNILAQVAGFQFGEPTKELPGAKTLTSVLLSATKDTAEIKIFVPTDEIKAITSAVGALGGLPGGGFNVGGQ